MNKLSKIIYLQKSVLLCSLLLLGTALAHAQVKTNKIYPKDSVIKVEIIDPFEKAAANKEETPDWSVLMAQITAKYDAGFADRLVNKAQIFYSYGKDWSAFTAALVRYTVKYEDPNNLPLLDKNAKMVLQFSTDQKELETALSWSKHTVDKEPGNKDYQKTYDDLKAKIAGN